MKCVLLQAPGETLEGLAELNKLGYSVQSYPVSQEVHLLRDTRYEDFASFMGKVPDYLDKPYARSLRVSFAKMLLDPAFADDDFIIFGESDATPIVKADVLRPVIERELKENPETDVFRLFLELSGQPSAEPSEPQHLSFEPLYTTQHTRYSCYVWGTHALVIPARSRRKVAELFLNWRLPIDNTLEVACAEKKLSMRVCRHNLFYQKPRTTRADITRMYTWRKRRMALCMASYKRPVDLQRQIYAMMNQSYDAAFFHLFVAVKGISEFCLRTMILPQFQPYIDAGRLTIRYFPNSNQLTNLLDCTRGLDVSDYELFLKIDDDDFYSRDYLRTINECYTTIPQHYSCFYRDAVWAMYHYNRILAPKKEDYDIFGATLVMSRSVWQEVQRSENEPDIISRTMSHGGGFAHTRIAYMEDNFIHRLMQIHGCVNIAPLVRSKGISGFIMPQHSNASVMRGGLVPHDLAQHVDVAEKDVPREHILFAIHPQWADTLRIYGSTVTRVSTGDVAEAVDFSTNRLTLKWHRWGEESFTRREDGAFILI